MVEFPYRMQLHFGDAGRKHEKDGQASTQAELQKKWGETPVSIDDPSSSPGTTYAARTAPEGQGMAVSPCPDPSSKGTKGEPPKDTVLTQVTASEDNAQIPRRGSRLHIEKG